MKQNNSWSNCSNLKRFKIFNMAGTILVGLGIVVSIVVPSAHPSFYTVGMTAGWIAFVCAVMLGAANIATRGFRQ